MSYIINNSRGQVVAVVADGTVNTTATDLSLVGRALTDYGTYENENYVFLLENFANNSAPPVVNAPPATVPPALTAPLVFKFPPVALPLTVSDPSVPTVVKLDVVTLALRVVPVISAAGALETTPVN